MDLLAVLALLILSFSFLFSFLLPVHFRLLRERFLRVLMGNSWCWGYGLSRLLLPLLLLLLLLLLTQKVPLKLLFFGHAFVVLIVLEACEGLVALKAGKIPAVTTDGLAMTINLLLLESISTLLTNKLNHV